jgi:hypothetical protein
MYFEDDARPAWVPIVPQWLARRAQTTGQRNPESATGQKDRIRAEIMADRTKRH